MTHPVSAGSVRTHGDSTSDIGEEPSHGTDVSLRYGTWRDFPLVGDWDGDGDDTVGVRQCERLGAQEHEHERGSRFVLRVREREALAPRLGASTLGAG